MFSPKIFPQLEVFFGIQLVLMLICRVLDETNLSQGRWLLEKFSMLGNRSVLSDDDY